MTEGTSSANRRRASLSPQGKRLQNDTEGISHRFREPLVEGGPQPAILSLEGAAVPSEDALRHPIGKLLAKPTLPRSSGGVDALRLTSAIGLLPLLPLLLPLGAASAVPSWVRSILCRIGWEPLLASFPCQQQEQKMRRLRDREREALVTKKPRGEGPSRASEKAYVIFMKRDGG